MSKPTIQYVSDVTKIPDYTNGSRGGYSPHQNKIYLVKGVSPEHTKQHELYHALKKHPAKPRNPQDYAQQEIEANLYAYRKCGDPKRILMRLKGIYNDLLTDYSISSSVALQSIKRAMGAVNAQRGLPLGWRNDYVELVKQVTRVNGR